MIEPIACPRCLKLIVAKGRAAGHIEKCKTLPTPAEFIQILDADEYVTLSDLAEEHGVGIVRIRDIVLAGESHWTFEKLQARGKENRYVPQRGAKRPRKRPNKPKDDGRFACADGCGVRVVKKGAICKFCEQERNGIKTRRDVLRLPPDDPRIRLLRASDSTYYSI